DTWPYFAVSWQPHCFGDLPGSSSYPTLKCRKLCASEVRMPTIKLALLLTPRFRMFSCGFTLYQPKNATRQNCRDCFEAGFRLNEGFSIALTASTHTNIKL